MPSIFDEIVDRRNTDSVKYMFWKEQGDAIPMWVADMDFKAPKEVSQALLQVAQHGVFGYTDPDKSYERAVCGWMLRNFGWTAEPDWNVKVPGVVFALAAAVRGLTDRGDAVLIQQPVYYPFMDVVCVNDRKLVINELRLRNGRYEIDFADFEEKIKTNQVKLFLLCSPHNPVGRVWTKEELIRMGEICLKYNVTVASDEIHADFVYSRFQHTVFADAFPALQDKTIICTAPSKTFNLAGLQTANIFIQDSKLRDVFSREIQRTGYAQLNAMGLAATKAAYTYGQAWRDEMVAYLEDSVTYVENTLAQTNGAIQLIKPEGTYLLWMDCRGLDLDDDDDINDFFANEAKLWLHAGPTFGESGSGFMRMNIACPRQTLQQAMDNMTAALAGI